MAEALGTNADITTALVKWMATKSSGRPDLNTRLRDALTTANSLTPPRDLTSMLARFIKTRNAP